MQDKAHITTEGLQKIINIKSSMNLGISDELKFNFIAYSHSEKHCSSKKTNY